VRSTEVGHGVNVPPSIQHIEAPLWLICTVTLGPATTCPSLG
jgi:hypothetical protein